MTVELGLDCPGSLQLGSQPAARSSGPSPIGQARSRKLSPDGFAGRAFTVPSSRSFATSVVMPVINQPQVVILSSGGITGRPVAAVDDEGDESIAVHSMGMLVLAPVRSWVAFGGW